MVHKNRNKVESEILTGCQNFRLLLQINMKKVQTRVSPLLIIKKSLTFAIDYLAEASFEFTLIFI